MKRFTLSLFLLAVVCVPARAVTCAAWNSTQFSNASGAPLSGGQIFVTQGGTTSAQPSYTSSTCGTVASNPVVLDAGGYTVLWLDTTLVYRLTVRTAGGSLIQTIDGVQLGSGGGGGGGGGSGAWTVSGNDQYNTNTGFVGVGNSTPIERLTVGGNVMLTGGGSLKLRNSDTTPYYVGQQAPASGMAANYTVTWPTALPGMVGCVKMSAAGVLSVDSACSTAPTDTIWSQDVMTKNVTLADGMATVSTVTIKDQTASTGASKLIVIGGAGQMANDTVFEVYDNTSALTAYIGAGGGIGGNTIGLTSLDAALNSGNLLMAASKSVRWSSDATWYGTADTCWARSSAGVAWVTDCMGNNADMLLRNLTVTGTCTGCGGGGSSLPVVDTTSIVKGNVTASKQARFDVETLVSAATTRSLTIQNASYVIAGTNIAQTISGTNTFSSNILALGTPNIGSTTVPFSATFATAVFGEAIKIAAPGSLFAAATSLEQITPDVLRMRDAAGNVMQDWTKTVPAFSSLTADFIPSDSTRTLGRTGNRWAKLWVVDVDVSGTCTGCGGGGGANTALSNLASVAVNTTINPNVTSARDMGTTALQWNNIYSRIFNTCDGFGANCWGIQSIPGLGGLIFAGPSGNRLIVAPNGTTQLIGASSGTLYPMSIADTGPVPGINFYRSSSIKAGSISSGATAAFNVQNQSDVSIFTTFQNGHVQVGTTTDQGRLFFVNGDAQFNGTTYVAFAQLSLVGSSVIAPSGAFGAGATFSCGGGQALKTLTVSGGIVTGATCGTP